MSKERLLLNAGGLAASGGGHTLRSYDLGMIFPWHGNGVSDGEHSAGVMNKEFPPSGDPRLTCGKM